MTDIYYAIATTTYSNVRVLKIWLQDIFHCNRNYY